MRSVVKLAQAHAEEDSTQGEVCSQHAQPKVSVCFQETTRGPVYLITVGPLASASGLQLKFAAHQSLETLPLAVDFSATQYHAGVETWPCYATAYINNKVSLHHRVQIKPQKPR